MFRHIKKLMYTVKAGTPKLGFGNLLPEQVAEANGERAAVVQNIIPAWS